jgi:hypothetical protein
MFFFFNIKRIKLADIKRMRFFEKSDLEQPGELNTDVSESANVNKLTNVFLETKNFKKD